MPTRVQRILDDHGALVFPGVYDTLSAKIAQRAGFPLAFISGYAVSATLIGEPDLGLLRPSTALGESVAQSRYRSSSTPIPGMATR